MFRLHWKNYEEKLFSDKLGEKISFFIGVDLFNDLCS